MMLTSSHRDAVDDRFCGNWTTEPIAQMSALRPCTAIQALSAVPRGTDIAVVDVVDREGRNLPFIRPGLNGEVVP
jgi:hypothetical protein